MWREVRGRGKSFAVGSAGVLEFKGLISFATGARRRRHIRAGSRNLGQALKVETPDLCSVPCDDDSVGFKRRCAAYREVR